MGIAILSEILLTMKIIYLLFFIALCAFSCGDNSAPVVSPPGYDLKTPQKFLMDEDLLEISGIVFLPGKDDSLYAIEDENGRLFYFSPADKSRPKYMKFGKSGDYEDVAVVDGNYFVVLRSDGSLYGIPAEELRAARDELQAASDKLQVIKEKKGKLANVEEYLNVLPEGEYEGLYGLPDGTLYALCKNCKTDDQKDGVTVFKLHHKKEGGFTVDSNFTIDVSNINLPKEQRRGKFHPSCLAQHPVTHEWYVISSVNKILLILDEQWKVKKAYSLKPSVFKQAEGLAFDSKGNMYVSNEGGDGNANVLLFRYETGR